MGILWQDFRYGMRMLGKSPGFTIVAIITLALGIGANSAIFSLVNAVLLRPLPFHDSARLVSIWETHPEIPRIEASYPDFRDWQQQANSFEGVAGYSLHDTQKVVLTGAGEPEQLQGTLASSNLFSVLGIHPQLGREFRPEEDAPGNNHFAILSDTVWKNHFGGDRRIIGQTIRLNAEAFTVIGVMPRGVQFPPDTDVWMPISLLPPGDTTIRLHHPVSVVARPAPGTTQQAAQTEMDTIARRLQIAYPATNRTIGAHVAPCASSTPEIFRQPCWYCSARLVWCC